MLDRYDLGRLMFGLSAIFLGGIGLWWRDFAGAWQPLDNLAEFDRPLVATVYAIVFLLAGAATLRRASAGVGLLTIAVLHFLAMLGWVPRVIAHGAWTGFFEMLSLSIAGVVGFAMLKSSSAQAPKIFHVGRIAFAMCLVVFGVSHFVHSAETAQMVPAWLPGGQMLWAYASGAIYVLAGIAVALNFHGALAGYLTVAMIILIDLFVWVPMLIGKPENFTWSGTAITFAIAAAIWVIADAIVARDRELRTGA